MSVLLERAQPYNERVSGEHVTVFGAVATVLLTFFFTAAPEGPAPTADIT